MGGCLCVCVCMCREERLSMLAIQGSSLIHIGNLRNRVKEGGEKEREAGWRPTERKRKRVHPPSMG